MSGPEKDMFKILIKEGIGFVTVCTKLTQVYISIKNECSLY